MGNSIVQERIHELRESMRENSIDYYVIPTGDFHQSEYVSDYFKTREFISGFTGSAGTVIVSQAEAGLWTDGRYFVQAEHELMGSGISLFRMQEDGIPSVTEYLVQHAKAGEVIAFDGLIVSVEFFEKLLNEVPEGVLINSEADLITPIWKDRPELIFHDIYGLPEDLSGKRTEDKLMDLRKCMKQHDGDALLLTKPEDIMWLYNIRGQDVEYNPIALSYAIINEEKAELYCSETSIDEELREDLQEMGVTVLSYEMIFRHTGQGTLLVDKQAVNVSLYRKMQEQYEIKNVHNYEMIPKAVKNEIEIETCKDMHLYDGIAVTRFIYYLKNMMEAFREAGTEEVKMTEVDAVNLLESFRAECPEYLYPSFSTIAAYGANAAMMHYEPTETSCAKLKPEGLLLVDSGGQYMGATTDVTRTIALGKVSKEVKEQYTAVLKGMLRLANTQFLYGCTGRNLDILAREPLWNMELDYRCGTGHGVGSFLSVHEGPQAFRWKASETLPEVVLEPGMIITVEPGVYIEGSHGIRIENELLCVEKKSNEWGRFLGFEILTYAPIDLDAVIPELLSEEEKQWLNVYHTKVYKRLCAHMEDNEKEWLREQTRKI